MPALARRGFLWLCPLLVFTVYWPRNFMSRAGSAGSASQSCQAGALGSNPDREELEALDRDIPRYVLKAAEGNERLALQRWAETLRWRCEIGDEDLFRRPNPNFFTIQKHYPTYLHLPDKRGRLTYWQRAGRLNPTGLLNEGMSPSLVRDDYVWQTLFAYDLWLKRDDRQEITIIVDMEGFSLSKITPTMLRIFSLSYSIIQKHFPDREHLVVVINAPEWWGAIWAFFKPLLPAKQQRKLRVSTSQKESFLTLQDILDRDSIPEEYGGSGVPLGSAPAEMMRRQYASNGTPKQ